jgi:hypothetical protein
MEALSSKYLKTIELSELGGVGFLLVLDGSSKFVFLTSGQPEMHSKLNNKWLMHIKHNIILFPLFCDLKVCFFCLYQSMRSKLPPF